MNIPAGTALGSIVVDERLESRGDGDLYLGHQPALGRAVLIRQLRDPETAGQLRNGFAREAQLCARVLHPNVVQVYDCFAHRGDHYLVTEYVEGPSLREVLQRFGRVDASIALRIALEIARGLCEIHARGIVHADIRPENIKLSRWGEVKIGGFAAARELDEVDVPAPESPGPYMPAELREGLRVDLRGDVYALAVLVCELFIGAPPGLDAPAAAPPRLPAALQPVAALLEPVLRLGSKGPAMPGVPLRLRSLLRRALMDDPTRRPSSRELRRGFERALGWSGASDSRGEIAGWLWEARLLRPAPLPGSLEPRAPTTSDRSPRVPPPASRPAAADAKPAGLRPRAGVAAGIGTAALLLVLGVWQLAGNAESSPEAPPVEASPPASGTVDSLRAALAGQEGPPAIVSFVAFPWAEIAIDDRAPFLTPRAAPIELLPGEHRIEFRHPTLGTHAQTVTVAPGERKVVRHVFPWGEKQ